MSGDMTGSVLTGAVGGAATGASVGGLPGAVIGAGIGGLLGAYAFSEQNNAQKRAMEQAERLRVQSIMKEFGLRQQADQNILAQTKRSTSSNTTQNTSPTGFMGANLASAKPSSSSGTF